MLPNAPHTHTLASATASAEFEKAEVKVYHAKGMDEWGTQLPLFEALMQEFNFNLDVAANAYNNKCLNYLTKEMDALTIDWWGRVWMNPPFSLTVPFLVKIIEELKKGHIEMGVALVAARPDTQISHYCSCFAGETRYLRGRLSFEVHPTDKQVFQVGMLAKLMADGYVIGDKNEDGGNLGTWKEITEEIGLPKTAIQKLLKHPDAQPNELSVNAPFPSCLFIFDKRGTASVVYWDWKKGVRTSYAFGKGGSQSAFHFVNAPLKSVKAPLYQALISGTGLLKVKPPSKPLYQPPLVDLVQMEKLLLGGTIPPAAPSTPEPASLLPTDPPPE